MEESPTGGNAWRGTQQRYWEAWRDLLGYTLGGPGAAGQGPEAFRQWWEALAHAAPPPGGELFDHFVKFTQPYAELAQRFAIDSTADAGAAFEAWLESMTQPATGAAGDRPASAQDSAEAFWELPLGNWERAFAALAPFPGSPWQSPRTEALEDLSGRLRQRADRFLAAPPIGYAREAQEQYQRLWRLSFEYLEAWQLYALGIARLRDSAGAMLRQRLAERASPPGSLREIYGLWVDACESAYTEYAMSEEHASRYARLVSALAAVKRHATLMLDEMLEHVNLPTRREIDSMHRYLHDARRENHALRAELEQLKHDSAKGRAAARERRPARRS